MKNYSKEKKSSSVNLPVIPIKAKAVMNITDDFNMLVKYLCSKITTIEWSGILFFESKGDIKDGIEITPIDIYPMDKGSSGYTEYDIGEEIFDYYEKHPKRFGMKYGHIHSHHNMNAYFSGTDMQELKDNCINHSYYVSLIVNNMGKMVAKIAIVGEKKNKATSNYTFKGLKGNLITIPKEIDSTENVMYTVDMEIHKETETLDEFFVKRVEDIIEKKRVVHNSYASTPNFLTGGIGTPIQTSWVDSREFEKPKTRPSEEVESLDVLRLCLGEAIGDVRELSEIFTDISEADTDENEIEFYLQQCLDLDSVIEQYKNLQRDFFKEPNMEDIVTFYEDVERLCTSFLHGSFKRIANIMIVVVVREINQIKQLDER